MRLRSLRRLKRQLRPRWRDWRFWVVQGTIFSIAVIHDRVEAAGLLNHWGTLYFVPVSLFLVPVVYAALSFGLAGALQTAVWCILIDLPNLIFRNTGTEQVGEAFQLAVIVAVAGFVGHRVDSEKMALARLERAKADLKAYAALILRSQEDERQRIARELHDETVQALVLLMRQLDSLKGKVSSVSAMESGLEASRENLEQIVRDLRDFTRTLRPPILDDLGLVASTRRLVLDFADRTGIRSRFNIAGEERRLRPGTELGLFRIAQEALWNIERHARATSVDVSLDFTDSVLKLELVDNGIGFVVPAMPGGFAANGKLGLVGMAERAELLGGTLNIQSGPGMGTKVSAIVPRSPKISAEASRPVAVSL